MSSDRFNPPQIKLWETMKQSQSCTPRLWHNRMPTCTCLWECWCVRSGFDVGLIPACAAGCVCWLKASYERAQITASLLSDTSNISSLWIPRLSSAETEATTPVTAIKLQSTHCRPPRQFDVFKRGVEMPSTGEGGVWYFWLVSALRFWGVWLRISTFQLWNKRN